MTIEEITKFAVRAYKADPPPWDWRRWDEQGNEMPTELPTWKTPKKPVKIYRYR